MDVKLLLMILLLAHPVFALENYYKLLGVNPGASPEEIKKAYHKQALKLHPDKNRGNPLAKKAFVEMKKAYDTLSDPLTRQSYDNYIQHGEIEKNSRMIDGGVGEAAVYAAVSVIMSGIIGVNVQQLRTDYKDYLINPTNGICLWIGTAPWCRGVCPPEFEAIRHHGGRAYYFANNVPDPYFGSSCWIGSKLYCCKSLNHTHLVALVGVVMEGSHDVLMLTEHMANGNLVDFLRSRGRHQVERSQLMQFAQNVADGMAYMESRKFVHRDLAARNILLDANVVAKISDFGLAQAVNQPTTDSVRGKFPIKWSAPEALRSSVFTSKSDVWSFGILLWELFSFGRVPYPRIPIQDVIRHIEKGYRMEPPEGCPTFITTLMTDCWSLEPHARPSFAEILLKLKRLSDLNGSL